MKVLLHYPKESTAKILAGYLSLGGRDVETVTRLSSLFERLNDGGYDAAVLCLPPADAWCEDLRRCLSEARSRLPIVIYDHEMSAAAIAAGVDAAALPS